MIIFKWCSGRPIACNWWVSLVIGLILALTIISERRIKLKRSRSVFWLQWHRRRSSELPRSIASTTTDSGSANLSPAMHSSRCHFQVTQSRPWMEWMPWWTRACDVAPTDRARTYLPAGAVLATRGASMIVACFAPGLTAAEITILEFNHTYWWYHQITYHVFSRNNGVRLKAIVQRQIKQQQNNTE